MVLFVYEYGYMYLCGVRENGIHQLFFYIIMNYKKPIYETPDMKVFEMHTEGVMCQSVNGVTIQDLDYDAEELGC